MGVDTQPIHAHAGVSRLLAVFAPVRRDEVAKVALLAVNVFVLLSAYYLLKVVREPLILLGGGAELKAYASAGQTLLLLAIVPGFAALAARVDRVRLLTTVQLIAVASLAVFYALAQARAPIGLAFYLWLGIFNVLVVSNFWSFANDVYTPEQGRRVFAVIGLGGSLGAIAGAFAPHALRAVLGLHALMLVAAGGLLVSIVIYHLVDRGEPPHAAPREAPAHATADAFRLVLRDRYLRVLAFMLLTATVINTTGEYVVGRMVTEHAHALPTYSRDDYIAGFYSDYYTMVNVASAVLQGLVVSRVMTRLGVRRALLILPVMALGGWLAVVLYANLLTVRIEKTIENSLDYSVHNTVRQALFLPTSRAGKYQGKAAIDTFFFRMGDVVAGLGVVFVFVRVLDLEVRAFAILNAALAVVWILLATRAGRMHDRLAQLGAVTDLPKAAAVAPSE
jgi:AAA family ATP:ADP antiporter